MKKLLVIIVPQEYLSANHKVLWNRLNKYINSEIVIIDIPADQFVTRIKKKTYRLQESANGEKSINEKFSIIRPRFLVRPEILPRFFNWFTAKSLMKQIMSFYPNVNKNDIKILCYSRKWIDILSNYSHTLQFYYYILDEFRYKPNIEMENNKAVFLDKIACEKSTHIFLMSEKIMELRSEFKNKMTIIGNGADYVDKISRKENIKYKKSVAFIGNFRNWIDTELLIEIISSRKDYIFAFVGPIEPNMKSIFEEILNNNINTIYLGNAKKEDISNYYRMFNVVIVPYKKNKFIAATRPIKIVESIFAGVPVVTIPVNGYNESKFIRFASTANKFTEEIDYLIEKGIDLGSQEYLDFLEKNSWDEKAQVMANIINK